MDPDTLLKTRRSVRRYRQEPVPVATLREIMEVARFAPSGGNRQGWQVVLVHEPEVVAQVFSTLSWLQSVGALPEGQRPVAYAVVISEGEPRAADCASLVTYILLAAHQRGVGTCWFGSIERAELSEVLGLPDGFHIAFVISLGYPEERFDTYDNDDETAVALEGGVVRVPKKSLAAILHENRFGGQQTA